MRTDEIINKVFTRSFMGYDIEQVDLFLDEVIEAMERYEAEKREMLSAMEYLMKKLEHGQKIPLSDMKKAIGSGRSQVKASLPESTEGRDEEQKTARSIARSGASKPIRAPKVSRVKGENDAKAQLIEEAKNALPQQELTPEEADKRAKRMSAAAVNWLDELLINIAEHEISDFEKPQQAATTQSPQQTESPQKPQQTATPQAQQQTAKSQTQQQGSEPAPKTATPEQTNEKTAIPPESNV